MLVDHSNRRLREVIQGRTHQSLEQSLNEIPGKENVKLVTLDMSDSYKSFCRSYFPHAELVADRFHVQRLIHPYLNQSRIEVTGDKRKNPVRTLMNKNRLRLKFYERSALDLWLNAHPKIQEIYGFKEQIVRFYSIRGYYRAVSAFDRLFEDLKNSQLQELQVLRRTFTRWRTEILNYFKYRITNARVEGFNNVAKVIKRRAYGYRSFRNYRLRLLNACS
jgi:transposase